MAKFRRDGNYEVDAKLGVFPLLTLFWYTYDDWLASITGVAVLGEVPLLVYLIVLAVSLVAGFRFRFRSV